MHLGEPQEGRHRAWVSGFKCLPGISLVRLGSLRMWAEGESEGLQTLGIVVVVCSSLKLLHYLGLIDFSDGKQILALLLFMRMCFLASVVVKVV